MQYCSRCGKQIPDDSHFCPNCGAELNSNVKNESTLILQMTENPGRFSAPVKIKLDGVQINELRNTAPMSIQVSPGEHFLELKFGSNPALKTELNIKENQIMTYPFKIRGGLPVYSGNDKELLRLSKKHGKGGRFFFKILIAVAVIMVFVLCINAINDLKPSGSNDNKADKSPETTVSSKGESVQTKTPSKEEPKPVFTPISDTLDNWEIEITDFTFSKAVSVGLLTGYKAADGSTYCVIDITAKNIGKESATFLPYLIIDKNDSYAKLIWGEYEYTRSLLEFAKDNLFQEELNPLVSAKGQLFFEVPVEMESSDIIPVLTIYQGKKSIKCELKKELQ